MKPHKIRVALLVGGPSLEHEVSLASGRLVHAHLDTAKYDVIPVVISRAGDWSVDPSHLPGTVDVAFIALHGEYGEDGVVQELLRDMKVPYTGSDHLASALGMNKILASRLLKAHGIETPESIVFQGHDSIHGDWKDVALPAVVKPANRGSSTGVGLARTHAELKAMIERALSHSNRVLIQKFVPGIELVGAVVDDGLGNPFPLPLMQISSASTRNFVPASLPARDMGMAQAVALRTHELVGASGVSTVDMILGEDGNLYVLEIDTIPSMGEASPLLQAALTHGMRPSELFDRIIEAAFIRHSSTKSR